MQAVQHSEANHIQKGVRKPTLLHLLLFLGGLRVLPTIITTISTIISMIATIVILVSLSSASALAAPFSSSAPSLRHRLIESYEGFLSLGCSAQPLFESYEGFLSLGCSAQ